MCGIVAYTGSRGAQQILVEGLKKLEYRGYDSAGVCIQDKKHLSLLRTKGKLVELETALQAGPLAGNVGIGHTRWAT
ncbi:MAG: glutamine--fructose-6-phosphate aminotransferase, partial [Fibrobacteria bacterium]